MFRRTHWVAGGDSPSEGDDGFDCFSRAQGKKFSWTERKRVRAVGAVMSSVKGTPPWTRPSRQASFSRRRSLWTHGMVMQVQTAAHTNGRVHPSYASLVRVRPTGGNKTHSVSNRPGCSEDNCSDGSCKDYGATTPEAVHFKQHSSEVRARQVSCSQGVSVYLATTSVDGDYIFDKNI